MDDLRDREDYFIWRVKCKGEWMAARIPAYCSLPYQYVIQSQNLGQKDLLPDILLVVIYNGKQRWNAPTYLASLMEPTAEVFKPLQLNVSYVLIDEGRYTDKELADNKNIAAILFRLENNQAAEDFDHGLTCLV